VPPGGPWGVDGGEYGGGDDGGGGGVDMRGLLGRFGAR
jgi:hypothetical protein